AEKAIERLKGREMRLTQEQDGLGGQDEAGLQRQQDELEAALARVAGLDDILASARDALPGLEATQRQCRQVQELAQRELHHIEAELNALRKLQQAAQTAEQEGAAWLGREGLDQVARLWQRIRVEEGWETAVEAALGEAMAALAAELRPGWATNPPEARFELVLPDTEAERPDFKLLATDAAFRPLVDLIHTEDPLVGRFLADRLALAFAADSLVLALERRNELPPGAFIATREGHRVGRSSLVFNAPEKGHHGLIARSREIERLGDELEMARARADEVVEDLAQADEALLQGRRQVEALQGQKAQAQAQAHQLQVSVARAQEVARRVSERRAQIERELDELYEQLEVEEAAWNEAGERQREAELEQEFARERLDEAREKRHGADQAFQAVREAQRGAERESQEAAFQVRSVSSRIKELSERLSRAEQAQAELAATQARLEGELGQLQEVAVNESLMTALDQRQEAEAALTAAREALEGANAALQALETARLGAERALEPLRDRLQSLELKLQESHLLEARFSEELEGVVEAEVQAAAEAAGMAGRGEGWLTSELQRLEAAIAELGPVNMAALQELEATQERKAYLDAQAEDLNTAAETLEEAIRRIDAETRARLKDTFDAVSREYRNLFTELFGGGEAQLILTGEEILDAGLVVMAQPPGKKNSSIHLLSGGEKALTALSLVFAFFRLNPAPFCLLDEVDAPLDDSNTERLCRMVARMSEETQFMFITHNRITMELAQHLVGVTMPEPGVSRPVAVDVENAIRLAVAA
ncbi:MAG: chromosome segregation protein SMC, partial [Gammaproteobacteria bacterium]